MLKKMKRIMRLVLYVVCLTLVGCSSNVNTSIEADEEECLDITNGTEVLGVSNIGIPPRALYISYAEEWDAFIDFEKMSKNSFSEVTREILINLEKTNKHSMGEIGEWQSYQEYREILQTGFLPVTDLMKHTRRLTLYHGSRIVDWRLDGDDGTHCMLMFFPLEGVFAEEAQKRAEANRFELQERDHPEFERLYYCSRLFDWKAEYGDRPVRETFFGLYMNRFVVIDITYAEKAFCDKLVESIRFEPITEGKNPFRQE